MTEAAIFIERTPDSIVRRDFRGVRRRKIRSPTQNSRVIDPARPSGVPSRAVRRPYVPHRNPGLRSKASTFPAPHRVHRCDADRHPSDNACNFRHRRHALREVPAPAAKERRRAVHATDATEHRLSAYTPLRRRKSGPPAAHRHALRSGLPRHRVREKPFHRNRREDTTNIGHSCRTLDKASGNGANRDNPAQNRPAGVERREIPRAAPSAGF